MNQNSQTNDFITIGWREWISLPELSLHELKAKVDTGARTSCLHAFNVEPFSKAGNTWVRFGVHPYQKDFETEIFCEAETIDKRVVSDSGGHKEDRYVILSDVVIGSHRWPIEITLTNRDDMTFRFLLGRTAMQDKAIVQPDASYLLGKPDKEA